MASYLEILRHAKNAAAALGVTGVVYSAYSSSGLPVPATMYQVETRIDGVRNSIQTVSAEVIDTQRSVLALRKNVLRSEKYTLSRTIEGSDVSAKLALTRRLGEIDDEITELEKKDDFLQRRMQSITSAARAPAQKEL
jgi:hypothetical protein